MNQPQAFWQKLFANFHRAHRFEEPEDFREYRDIRYAIHVLRTATGYTRERLAQRIGISYHTLNLLESRGGRMSQRHCERCEEIAWEFEYPRLREWFRVTGFQMARTKRTRRTEKDTDEIERHVQSGLE